MLGQFQALNRVLTKMKLFQIRAQLGLTQEQLAKELGYTTRQIQRWEAGDAPTPKLVQYWIAQKLFFKNLT